MSYATTVLVARESVSLGDATALLGDASQDSQGVMVLREMSPRPSSALNARVVKANGLEFAMLEVGSGPLALCLHGFPDSAHTWRYLLPALSDAGFHAVAPFMRG
jgi:hypothetical protein